MKPFELTAKLPFKQAADALHRQLVDYLIRENPKVGEPFLSDAELVKASGLSRMTVRRALSQLAEEGWIERRHGVGTFIGPRAALDYMPLQRQKGGQGKRLVRVAVMGRATGREVAEEWVAQGILAGMDDVSLDAGISVELISDRNLDKIDQRLMLSRPDVFVMIIPGSRQLMALPVAEKQGIKCLIAGCHIPDVDVPCISEDNKPGAEAVADRLLSSGHKRVGVMQQRSQYSWSLDRVIELEEVFKDRGARLDRNGIFWGGRGDHGEALRSFLNEYRPDAMVAGCYSALRELMPAIKGVGMQVPRDCSIITWDQAPWTESYVGMFPDTVKLPLFEIGRRLAHSTRDLVEENRVGNIRIPCCLIPGKTVICR